MKLPLAAAAAAFAFVSSPAVAQDWSDVHGTIGVRAWGVEWSTWFLVPGFLGGAVYKEADRETAIIPVASLRYKDFLLAGSYMASKDYQFPVLNYPKTERREYDINFGYFVAPSLAVTIGYKDVKYDTTEGFNTSMKGPTLGASGSAPVAPWMSLYGSIATGLNMKLNDSSTFHDVKAKYLVTELGLAFPLGQMSPSFKGFVVTTGYRYQRIGGHANSPGYPSDELYETTQGFVLGLSYSM